MSCCPPTRVPALTAPSEYKVQGEWATFGDDLKVYVNGDAKNAKGGIILIADIFGVESGRHRAIADTFVNEGYYVIAPDLFCGKPCPLNVSMTELGDEFLPTWSRDKWEPNMDLCYAHLAEKKIAPENTGLIGFCWGSWAIFLEGEREAPYAVGVNCHPSVKIEEWKFDRTVVNLAKAVKRPQCLIACADDPDNVKPDGEVQAVWDAADIGAKCEYHTASKNHGFVSQGDVTDEETFKEVEKATNIAINYFATHIAKE